MQQLLLDTGVLLRLLDAGDPLHRETREAVERLGSPQSSFATTLQNVCEFWNVSTRPASARGGLGLDSTEVEQRILMIDRLCAILMDESLTYSVWRRLVSTYQVVGASVHDAHLVATMITHNVKAVLTLNDRDFRRYSPEGIQVFSPSDVIGP